MKYWVEMEHRIKLKISERTKKSAKIFGAVFVLLLIIFVASVVAYGYDFSGKVLPKVAYATLDATGKSKAEVKAVIAKLEEEKKPSRVKLVRADKSWEVSFEDLVWTLDEEKTADQIFSYGHSPKLIHNIVPLLRQLFLKKEFSTSFEIDQNFLEDFLNSINGEIGSPKREANLQVKSADVKIIEPSVGEKIDEIKIKKEIYNILDLKSNSEVKIELIKDEPEIAVSDVEKLRDKAKELVGRDIVVIGPKGEAKITSAALGTYIEIKREVKEKKTLLTYEKALGEPYVSFNSDKIREFLEKSSDDLNIAAIDAKLEMKDGQVSVYQASRDGKTIDLEQSIALIIAELEKNGAREITLPSKVQAPAISAKTAGDITKYGIRELIGSAATDFSGSPQNRISNIKTGVSYISGALIKPGEEFSTIKKLGTIDKSQGYLPELVIKENATVPEYGGGLCQVSTTLFRTALNSGLKITERQNHSYRVPYYEPPVGMDATVYSPKPDLKFINDTSAYILIQGRVEGKKIIFDFYGTKDGREVMIGTPTVYAITPPPPTIYIDDPTLAPGQEVRVDRAHNGAKAKFTYVVKKSGKEIINQTFTSSYVPWAAKYRRGPQVQNQPTENTPTPTPQPSEQPSPSPSATASS